MKLKINPKFTPCQVDDGDEIYPNGVFHFNITKMLKYIEGNLSLFSVETVEVKAIHSELEKSLDEATIQKANLERPIILGEIAPNRFNVIDGNHRLEKAFREGILNLKAHRIGPKDHLQFLITEAGYKAYVNYWNEKIKSN